jgi:hypothetical protein
MPDNDMGKPTNITNRTFETAAREWGQGVLEAKKNALELLKKVLGEQPSTIEKVDGFDKYR